MSLDILAAPRSVPTREPFPRRWTADEYARMLALAIVPTGSRLTDGTIEIPDTDGDWVPLTFTRKEYYGLCDNRFFGDQRVQLIAGEIVQELPMNPPHANGIRYAKRGLEALYGKDRFDVSVQLPVDLGLISEPHPDFAVLAGPFENYADEHPKTAVLIVEISDSTLDNDLTDKASLYAAGGIADYWVIDVNERVLHAFHSPMRDDDAVHGVSYKQYATYRRDDTIAVPGLPGTEVPVSRIVA